MVAALGQAVCEQVELGTTGGAQERGLDVAMEKGSTS